MAMVRSPRTSLNSIGEDKRSGRSSLNLSISSIKDLMSKGEVPDYPDEGLGDDEVFGTEAPKDAVTKALGALSGKVSSEKAVSDAAMRAMFAKKAARTIHDSLKQKAKRMFILVYTRLILILILLL